jgi:hypothetical protein
MLLSAAASTGAADVQVQIGANGVNEIFEGESVDYYVQVQNTKGVPSLDLSGFAADFDCQVSPPQTRSQVSVFNGRMTQQVTYLFGCKLTPKRAGTLAVPAPIVNADGQKLTGQSGTLKVLAPEKQDLVIAELLVSKPRVYPTQPFDVTLRILVKPLPDIPNRDPLTPLQRQLPNIELNWMDAPEGLTAEKDAREWLRPYVVGNRVGFTLNNLRIQRGGGGNPFEDFDSVFDQRATPLNLQSGREKRNGLDGQPVEYFVYELKRTFIPEKAGVRKFGPALIKGQFVNGGSARGYTGRRLVVVAPVQTLEVREVPAQRPETFCGGIGTYQLNATATPAALRVGDPLTLRLEFVRLPGSGSLDLIGAPDLTANPRIAEDFEIMDKAPTGETKGDIKRFNYGLRPKKQGVSLPALTVSLFDPAAEKFTELTTRPIALNVTQAATLATGEIVGRLNGDHNTDIKSRAQGIFQNINDLAELGNQRVSVWFVGFAAAAPWLFFVCLALVVTGWRRRANDSAWQRRQHARRDAEHRLRDAKAALDRDKGEEALKNVRAAIAGLIADMRNTAAEGMTAHEAAQLLAACSVSEDVRGRSVKVLETVEAAAYGSTAGLNIAGLIATAQECVPALYRELDGVK